MRSTTIAIIIGVVLITSALVFVLVSSKEKSVVLDDPVNVNNVSIVDGKQIIEITAKGGFNPAVSSAKAGVPTVLRFKTNGTFDCSSTVRIPSLNVFKSLNQSGNTDIEVGTPKAGILRGMCGMGMYPFSVNFAS